MNNTSTSPIAKAQSAIDAIPFRNWSLKEIQDLAVMALAASSMEYGSAEQILELGTLLGHVTRALNGAIECREKNYNGMVQRAVYAVTGKLHVHIANPDALLTELGESKAEVA